MVGSRFSRDLSPTDLRRITLENQISRFPSPPDIKAKAKLRNWNPTWTTIVAHNEEVLKKREVYYS
jgi:hypothetical protein